MSVKVTLIVRPAGTVTESKPTSWRTGCASAAVPGLPIYSSGTATPPRRPVFVTVIVAVATRFVPGFALTCSGP